MKQKTPATTQPKRSAKTRLNQRRPRRGTKEKETIRSSASNDNVSSDTSSIVSSDPNTGPVVSGAIAVDDLVVISKNADAVNGGENLDDSSSDSDSETVKDSVSCCGDSLTTEEEKVEIVPKNIDLNSARAKCEPDIHESRSEVADMKETVTPSPDSSDGKEMDLIDETLNGTQSAASDNERVEVEENGGNEDEETLNRRIEEMETRIGKLEEELREVAALEIALYSVVPEHGSSAHKVHTPARRLSRLYIHAGKHWTLDRRATIAKNTVSGLVLIARSCSNDAQRLTYWLSNTIVLREIICQAFGSSRHSRPLARFSNYNGSNKRTEGKPSPLNWKGGLGSKKLNGSVQFADDWQETGTFMAALEKVESWIFSRIVESVWWQSLTPHMQSPKRNSSSDKMGKLLGPALGDQEQGSFSINLWKHAFQDAFHRLCPVRAGGHECGCLPVMARMVMEQCVARLDVAMFNAILRESAHEIPTDPVSDPIVDSKVLPIPAGDLSFGSGAQLKNSVGNWSRWLSDLFGMDADDSLKEDQQNDEEEDERKDSEPNSFHLLNDLSDLLMLPKDMLMDRSIRKEVCPSIGLPLIKRILCNFTPDEFCPDPVPGAVLEALNAEGIIEQKYSGESARNFPYTASPVTYSPPSSTDIAEKVAEAGAKSQLSRNVSMVQRKGYTSDEELEELDSPLTSIIENLASSPTCVANGNGKHNDNVGSGAVNVRYALLREVWSA